MLFLSVLKCDSHLIRGEPVHREVKCLLQNSMTHLTCHPKPLPPGPRSFLWHHTAVFIFHNTAFKKLSRSSPGGLAVKDLALTLLWLRFDSGPGTCICRGQRALPTPPKKSCLCPDSKSEKTLTISDKSPIVSPGGGCCCFPLVCGMKGLAI